MRRFAWISWLLILGSSGLLGCANSSAVMKGNMEQAQKQQAAMSGQVQSLSGRVSSLDQNNQDLHTQLAQARQQATIAEDQASLVRSQLAETNSQLARLREDLQSKDNQAKALTASMRRSGSVQISPNNSLLQTLPAINLEGVQVRRDGDVIRIEVLSDRLFQPGSSQLSQEANYLLGNIAGEIARTYPHQMIGIEAHTDNSPAPGYQWQSQQHLSVGQAMAIYEALAAGGRLHPKQIFVVGYGSNQPAVSNATAAGKARNRRIDIVINPEQVGR